MAGRVDDPVSYPPFQQYACQELLGLDRASEWQQLYRGHLSAECADRGEQLRYFSHLDCRNWWAAVRLLVYRLPHGLSL